MTEKDFRKLVTDLEILNTEKQELHCRFDRLQEKLAKHQDDYFRIVSVKKSGSWAKGTLLNDVDKIDIMVGIELIKPNSFVLDNYYVLNAIENIIIAEYPSITKLSNIDRNLQFNTISFKENDIFLIESSSLISEKASLLLLTKSPFSSTSSLQNTEL